MSRILCWLGRHDWRVTCCGFGPNDHYRDCARCHRREWETPSGWVAMKPDDWSPVTHPYGTRGGR